MFPKIINKSQRGSPQFSRLRRNVVSNSRAYALFFTYLVKLDTLSYSEKSISLERQPHDETAGQVRPDGVQPEPPLHTNGCQTRSSIDPKQSSFPCTGMVNDATRIVNIWVRTCSCSSPELSGLIRWLASTTVFGAGQH